MNGSLAVKGQTVGGGDMVLFKFFRSSGIQPDILIPKSAQEFVVNPGRLFSTRPNGPQLTTIGIVALFLVRVIQGVCWSFRSRQKYDVALSASPFSVDVIPVWFWKARCKGAVIYHLIPRRKPVNFATRIRFGIAAVEQKVMMNILRRACDFIVAGNEFTKRQLEEQMPGKPIFILPAGFDAAAIDRVASPSKEKNLGCFIGRLVSQKGIFDLLKIMGNLGRSHPEFRLVMAGTGPERDFLAAEIQRLNLTNVQLVGFVSEEDKLLLLKKSKYFFFPSYEEGWGIALAEALYCECRCLCYELPHYWSIFCDFPVYVRPGDTDDFTRAFQRSGEVSPEQKPFMRQYDDRRIVRQLVEHLDAVAKARGASSSGLAAR